MRRITVCFAGAVAFAAWMGGQNVTGRAAGPPPTATFTPNVRADTGNAVNGQNEPQVAVDQSGTAYVTWQSNSRASRTADGVSFTYLGFPDSGSTTSSGDVAITTTTWPSANTLTPIGATGTSGTIWLALGSKAGSSCGAIEERAATLNGNSTVWNAGVDASCQPAQVDRDWVAAYTPPAARGTTNATSATEVFTTYHDFGVSNMWVTRSFDGGHTNFDTVQYPAIEGTQPNVPLPAPSVAMQTTTCNTIPGDVAVDQRGVHQGRVYVAWSTSDLQTNASQGCNITQAEAFDHLFVSYSDDIGNPGTTLATATWHSFAAFNDPCAPNPPTPPVDPTNANKSCEDISEIFTPMAVDDAGNVYVAFVWYDKSSPSPHYDIYLEVSKDGGQTWNGGTANHPGKPILASADEGTNYFPWITAGQDGAVDIVYYGTKNFSEAPAQFGKPGAAPGSTVWDVYMAQTLDGGQNWTQSKVSDRNIYFGDICTTGIFCGGGSQFGWGDDRILLDDFGVAIGPDGGARVAWTDSRDFWPTSSPSPGCGPSVSPNDDTNVSCQNTHLYFACQTSGLGLHGETVSGCGQSQSANIAETRWVPALFITGAVAAAVATRRRRRHPAT